jgi:cell division protein FtsL
VLRLLYLLSLICLIGAAVVLYKVKYESTYEAQRAAKLRGEIHVEREKIAALRAEWSRLAAPARIQSLAARHLGMKPLDPSHIDDLSSLPAKPKGSGGDPIGEFIETLPAGDAGRDPLGDFLRALNGERSAEATGSVRGQN